MTWYGEETEHPKDYDTKIHLKFNNRLPRNSTIGLPEDTFGEHHLESNKKSETERASSL